MQKGDLHFRIFILVKTGRPGEDRKRGGARLTAPVTSAFGRGRATEPETCLGNMVRAPSPPHRKTQANVRNK